MKVYVCVRLLALAGVVMTSRGSLAQLSFGSDSSRSPALAFNSSAQLVSSELAHSSPPISDPLTCSPTPCVLRSVLTSPNQAINTTVSVNPTNLMQLLAGAELQGCALAYGSTDGGSSWYFGDGSCLEGGSPTLAYGRNGTGYLAGGSSDIALATTQDNGNTWSQPAVVVSPVFNGGSALTPWLAVDNTKSSRFYNRLYIAATQSGPGQVLTQISVSFSDDGGQTWVINTVDKVQIEPSVDQFSRVSIASDGTVYAAWQRCTMIGRSIDCGGTNANMLLSKSSDGGNTWSR